MLQHVMCNNPSVSKKAGVQREQRKSKGMRHELDQLHLDAPPQGVAGK